MKAKGKAAMQAQRGGSKKKDEEIFTDKGGKKYRYVVPMKFSRPDESGIFVKVEGAQTFNFDSTSPAKSPPTDKFRQRGGRASRHASLL